MRAISRSPIRTTWPAPLNLCRLSHDETINGMADLEPRNFLQPCLLLLLAERADHGYELASRMRPLHDGEGDSGGVYRALRGMEKHGLVRSEWRTSDVGPARRTYHITAAGLALLAHQVQELQR